MISIDTAVSCATQIRRWQTKHKISEYKIEELLRWMSKCKGNASFNNSMRAISKAYKLQGDVGETEESMENVRNAEAKTEAHLAKEQD